MKINKYGYHVLLVDDHAIFRNGFYLVLQKHIEVMDIYHASNGMEALEILSKHPINLVFLDYYMPVMNGEKCMIEIKKNFPHVKVIVISMMNSADDIIQMKNAGAHGFIVKNFNGDELGLAVKTVMAGRKYYDSYVSDLLMHEKTELNEPPESYEKPQLTEREKQILQMIASGELSKEIAEKLKTSQNTVEKQRKMILKKINGRGIADAIRFSLRNGIVNINDFLHQDKKNSQVN